VQKISAEQLKGMKEQRDDFLLVNTLPAEHFESTKIEGSVNIPQDQDGFADLVASKQSDKTKPVVVYCASDSCDSSVKAAEKLDRAGFEHVYEFEDGAKGWKEHCSAAGCS